MSLVEEDRPVLITQDNLAAHLSIDLMRFCKERKLEMVSFPARTTQILQPADALFNNLKLKFADIARRAQLAKPTGLVTTNVSGIIQII